MVQFREGVNSLLHNNRNNSNELSKRIGILEREIVSARVLDIILNSWGFAHLK